MDSPQGVALALQDTGSASTGSQEFLVGVETFKLLQNVRYSLAAVACIILYEWFIKYVLFYTSVYLHFRSDEAILAYRTRLDLYDSQFLCLRRLLELTTYFFDARRSIQVDGHL